MIPKILHTIMETSKIGNSDLILLYEVIERIVRFDIHLEEIKNQFYLGNENKLALIDDFKKELMYLFAVVISQDNEDFCSRCKEVITCINELHSRYLSIFPRPSEPVELTRFERVIKKQIVCLRRKQELKVSIATNENLGENANADPLDLYKHNFKPKIVLRFPRKVKPNNDQDLITVTIPRIDAPNTFRWPSLIHEMCHPLLDNISFNNGDIKSDFLSFISKGDEQSIFDSFFYKPIDNSSNECPHLENWLSECYCDLLACLLIGPSFYFSQFTVFLMNYDQTSIITHPPHQLRLSIIESFLERRYKDIYKDLLFGPIMKECNDLLERVQSNNKYRFDGDFKILNEIFTSFREYFLSVFFENGDLKGDTSISKQIKTIIKRYVSIQSDTISTLSERLKQGLPIPSIRTLDSKGNYKEIPTYVQEILLSSWLAKLSHANGGIDDDNNGLIDVFRRNLSVFEEKEYDSLYIKLKRNIVRHDQAVLKSIQVSEWFDFFIREKRRPSKINILSNGSKTDEEYSIRGLLVDKEIKSLIRNDEIKIIPFMYMDERINGKEQKQIGTTSVDIRLGSSFQLFTPNQYEIVDFTRKESGYNNSSKRIDLDFLESIVIAPGQFMLGHSMEYIKLPNTICGNLEGRSSFARLGIEIHMTAGFIDPGFEGVITFEIYNSGPSAVRLFPGMRIGQLRFESNSHPTCPYSKHDVKYKGLLEHNLSLQSKDIEVALISDYLNKSNKRRV